MFLSPYPFYCIYLFKSSDIVPHGNGNGTEMRWDRYEKGRIETAGQKCHEPAKSGIRKISIFQ